MENALKFAAGKSVHLSYVSGDGWVRIIVRDEGIGIAPENFDKNFDRFERVASSQTVGGLGLGLYISKQIIEAHGGRISVESQPGKGATFAVDLLIDSSLSEGRPDA